MIKFILLIGFGATVFDCINATETNGCEESPDPRCKKPNEEYQECPKRCPYGVCGINDLAVTCERVEDGDKNCLPPACKCKFGYYRDDQQNCVKFEDCPKCDARPNEVYDPCFFNCPSRRCDVDNRLIKCAPPPAIGDPNCISGCRCKDGYKTNKHGICIPEGQCPPFCGANEVPSNCTNGGCSGARYCSEKGAPKKCEHPKKGECIKGCLCKKGYLRDDDTNECIPEDQCPKPCEESCTDPNEFLNECASSCSKDTCASLYDTRPCIGPAVCLRRCQCKEGFVKDKNNVCIPKDDCPIVCLENEVPSNCTNGDCFGARYCSEIGAPIKCAKLREGECIKGCLCKKGYLRDDDTNECIPENQCPQTCEEPCTDPNEFLNECANSCTKNTCESLYDTEPCIGPAVCLRRCQCKEGWVKNKNNVCIPKADCPCKIGESFQSDDGCNMCRCRNGRRGDSPCTLKACVTSGPITT